jgi:soluble lytic murein transglycosylase-like protein
VRIPALFFVFCSLPLWSAQFAVLQSGFHLPFDRAEKSNGELRLYRGGGHITLRESDVVEWIQEEDPKPPSQATPTETPKSHEPTVKELIAAAANKHGLPTHFVDSVARAESAHQQSAVSPKGAIGVMQLMPSTARALGVDPRDVRENIEGGTKLLRDLLIQYQDDPDQVRKALAAYNAGPGAVKKYNGIPPYRETQNYVDKILKTYQAKSN